MNSHSLNTAPLSTVSFYSTNIRHLFVTACVTAFFTAALFTVTSALSFMNSANANETNLGIQGQAIKGLVIEKAWIVEAPPVSKVMAAYLSIKNTGQETINIIRAESDLYSSIEFHETRHEDGMARMIRHTSLTIPAESELVLKRGGRHLMLFNPIKPLKEGDTVVIKFITENKAVKTISVPVKKAQH